MRRRFTIFPVALMLGVTAGCSQSIHNLVARGDLELLRARLEASPSACNDRNREGKTALHYAINFAQRDAFVMLAESGGCDVNAADRTGMTPLHSAAFIGLPAAVPMLLEQGADLEAKDRFGDTPLHTAAMRGHVDMVRALLDAGADASVTNRDGRTPAELAGAYGHGDVAAILEPGD